MATKNFINNNYFILLLSSSLFLLLTFLVKEIHCVRITSVNIPSYFTLDDDDNTEEKLVLDCEYEVNENETDLLVKWFKDNEAIYQWIDGQEGSAFPKMSNKIDPKYIVSDDPRHQYRAVLFPNPSVDLSGDYKCLIQTAQSADTRIAHLEILDMTNITFKLNTEIRDDDTLVTCSVSNIKPKPTLELRLNKDEDIEIDDEDVFNNTQGFFEVIVKGNVSNDQIDSDSEFGCLLSFDGTNYTRWHSELHSGSIMYVPSIEYSLLSTFAILTLSAFIKNLM